MLIEFSVQNATSIKDEMILSAETGERLSRLKETNTIRENNSSLLKNLMIIGPNGSGKTNIINALKLMRSMVLNDPDKITTSLPYNPFRLNTLNAKAPTKFQVKFNYGNQTFQYSFSYVSKAIVAEKLTQVLKTTERTIFAREGQNYPVLDEELKKVAANTKKNSLFLFNAQKANISAAITVLEWFQKDLVFVNSKNIIPDQLTELMDDKRIKDEFLRFLRFADFNIIDVKVRDIPLSLPEEIKKIMATLQPEIDLPDTRKELYASHKQYDGNGNVIGTEEIPLTQESRGTQKIFLIALSIINAHLNGNGKTILFDEFDDSLHFELSKALVEIFNSKQNRNQFILTTHELQLLNSELRTDQIYLVEKDFQGRSSLYSVFDFKDSKNTARHDVQYMKRYIEGRFGSLPQIDVDEMLSALNASNPPARK